MKFVNIYDVLTEFEDEDLIADEAESISSLGYPQETGDFRLEYDDQMAETDQQFIPDHEEELENFGQEEVNDLTTQIEEFQKELVDIKDQKKELLEELHKLKIQTEEILSKANKEASEIREKSKEEGRREGYSEGYNKGKKDGYSIGKIESQKEVEETLKADANALLNELKEIIHTTQIDKERILDKYKNDLKDIAVAVAEKVIHISLKSSGDVIKRMIISATEGIKSKEWVKVYIAKCDAEMIVDGDSELISSLSSVSDHVKIIVMEQESSGTCILELPDKVIDASTNTQIENIKEILSNARI